MNKALLFYTKVLQFEILLNDTIQGNEYSNLVNIKDAVVQIAKLKLGDEKIELIQFIFPDGKAYPEVSHSNDLWFQNIAIITSNLDSAYALLKLNNISVEP